MARSLRIERTGGPQRVKACGNERRDSFRDDSDPSHLLEQLARLSDLAGKMDDAALGQALSRCGNRLGR